MKNQLALFVLLLMPAAVAQAEDWPQAAGPNANYVVQDGTAPTTWSVVNNTNIAWTKTLPETGQSTVTISGGKLYFTCLEPVEADSQLGSTLIAYCCDAKSGKTLWERKIEAKYPLKLSGCFSDSSAPPAVTDGERVCFFNASGTIACFDLNGKPLWTVESMAVGRSQPFLIGGSVCYIKQSYMPEQGKFSHAHADDPLEKWTQLQAISMKTGKPVWNTTCGVNMGSIPIPWTLADGQQVIMVGRGGGHGPPEKPEGVSLVSAKDGSTIWTLPLDGFMSTQTFNIHKDRALIFHGNSHLSVDLESGKVIDTTSFVKDVNVLRFIDGKYVHKTETLPGGTKGRSIIQQGNLLVGDYHYFRSYTHNYIGRINLTNNQVELLELPTQLVRESGKDDLLIYTDDQATPAPGKKKGKGKGIPIQLRAKFHNDMKNSRGFVVMGDPRSQGNGWGHHSTAIMTSIGGKLYVPIMNGTVFVLQADAKKLDQKAILAINDLGPAGGSWNRASLSYSDGKLYAHTIKQVICIGKE